MGRMLSEKRFNEKRSKMMKKIMTKTEMKAIDGGMSLRQAHRMVAVGRLRGAQQDKQQKLVRISDGWCWSAASY